MVIIINMLLLNIICLFFNWSTLKGLFRKKLPLINLSTLETAAAFSASAARCSMGDAEEAFDAVPGAAQGLGVAWPGGAFGCLSG